MSASKKNAVVILGAPRSGISTFSGCLYLLGTKFGIFSNPVEGEHSQPNFFLEEVELIHDLLFRDLEVRWDMVGAFPRNWDKTKAAERAKEKLLEVWERHFKGSHLWAVNDPRMCRLMPLWNAVFAELGIEPSLVFISRHPREVAASLCKNNHIGSKQAQLLWLVYNREALSACQNANHTLITYDQLLADPISTLENISSQLKFNYPRSLRRHAQKILNFVRTENKHHHAGNSEADPDDQETPFTWLFDQLRMRQLLTGPQHRGNGADIDLEITDGNENPVLPILTATSDLHASEDNMAAVTAMFSNLLDRIGEHERKEWSSELKAEKRHRQIDQQQKVAFCQMLGATDRQVSHSSLFQSENKRPLPNGEWVQVQFILPPKYAENRKESLTFLLSNQVSLVTVSALNLVEISQNKTIWSANAENQFADCAPDGTVFQFKDKEALKLVATGPNPLLKVSLDKVKIPDRPVKIVLWIKVDTTLGSLETVWRDKEKYIKTLFEHRRDLQNEKELWAKEKEQLETSLEKAREELGAAKQSWKNEKTALKQAQVELKKHSDDYSQREEEWVATKRKLNDELSTTQKQWEEEKKEWTREKASLVNCHDELLKQVNTLKSSFKEDKQKQKSAEQDWIQEKNGLSQEIEKQREKFRQLQKQHEQDQANWNEQNQSLSQQLDEQKAILEESKNLNESLEKQVHTEQEKFRALKAELVKSLLPNREKA